MRSAFTIAIVLTATLVGCGGEDVANCAALRRGAPAKALEHCNRAIDSGRLSPQHLVVAYFDRGSAQLQKGAVDAGIEDLDEAIRLDPLYADAFSNRALARRMKGQLEKAFADANAALKITPRHARALLQRGATYLVQGDGNKALADLDEAIRLDPGLQAAWNIRGLLRRAARDWDRALADFDPALLDLDASLKLDPRSTEALLRRAAIYGERGDLARMRADQNAAAALQRAAN